MKAGYAKDNVWAHNKLSLTKDKHYCQLAVIIGHHSKDGAMYKDDFYQMVMRASDNNKGIRKSMDNRPGPTFEFDTEVERDNFIKYLKTDFARFCLGFLKIGQNVYNGELALIPWLNFKEEWDDEKLFNVFEISEDLQQYIREFLPDYYGIRK